MKFFDSHIHLNSGSVVGWENAKDWIFNNVSTTLEDFHVALEQSLKHSNVYVTAGIHPLELDENNLSEIIDDLDRFIRKHRDRIIAIGETGLDFYRADKDTHFNKQGQWLYAQYELAKKYDLPLVIHVRNAHEEMLQLLSNVIVWRGVIHCFEADERIMNRYLALEGV